MFKGHPKGLFVAFFTNMGERFGFYTMMAILVLFLQARYGLTAEEAGNYYSWFYYAIYALALIGGMFADWSKKYKSVICIGQVIMFAGYCIIAIPGMPLYGTLAALLVIAFGNGLFKGNLQAVVGQLYDDEKYAKIRDNAFMIFYMGINVGAFFAPFVATGIRNWWLHANGFGHDGSIPALCHHFLDGKLTDTAQFQALADKVSGQPVAGLTEFAHRYLDVFSKGYNYAFAIAAGAMTVSLIIYLVFNKSLPAVAQKAKTADVKTGKTFKAGNNVAALLVSLGLIILTALVFHYVMNDFAFGAAMGLFVGFVAFIFLISARDERPRIVALTMVFAVVVFFWMSFHQNGLTLTYFARDYTAKSVAPFTSLFFNLNSLLCVIGTVSGLVLVFGKNRKWLARGTGFIMSVSFGCLCYFFIARAELLNAIDPEIFQAFNPLFIVALTPLVMGVFNRLRNRDREPSTPRKIGIGMFIAAIGFVVVLIGSTGLVSPKDLGNADIPESMRVSPYWLMSSYLILTIAELFLSPMGLSFVSKVAPVRFQGLMQGGWLLATATGNKLLFIGSALWGKVELYMLWGIFVICCIVSAIVIFSIMKRLEKATR
jgi:POT family proton-dependent oligopeptide transporter